MSFIILQGQAIIGDGFFSQVDALLKTVVVDGHIDYVQLAKDDRLKELMLQVQNAEIHSLSPSQTKAFYINAYNLTVMEAVLDAYPLSSVQKITGFFDRIDRKVANQTLTLNELEKRHLLEAFNDPRLHFVLVCGAKGCPPIINEVYAPARLDDQLDVQTRKALNDPDFIKVTAESVSINQIFEWYPQDFGGSKKSIFQFINQFRELSLNENLRLSYYGYDWRLNDIPTSSTFAPNAARYVVSAAIPQGSAEIKIFNNLYTQRTGTSGELTNRSTFFTSLVSVVYGISNRFNLGFELRYRRVYNTTLPDSPLNVFGSHDPNNFRQGITTFGPRIRFAPIPKWRNFSIQSTLQIPMGKDQAGTSETPYIDWNGVSFWNQFFNDIPLGSNFSLFTELDLFLEDIGPSSDNHANRFSTPVTGIISYFPNPKTTIYGLAGFSPYWQSTFDYFVQGGIGFKYQFTPNFELELLYTGFTNKFLIETEGRAATYNFGIRSNL